MNKVLTIAGSDSGGGAGIQADLKTFAARGVYGTSAVTAITAQNTIGVQSVFILPARFVEKQIDSIMKDINCRVWKTGMLANSQIVAVAARKAKEYHISSLVVDPVMMAKSGDSLLEDKAVVRYIKLLIPLSFVITPNRWEAQVLAGIKIIKISDMYRAAKIIHQMGAKHVVIKGGHLYQHEAIDILYDGESFTEFKSQRIKTKNTHGTGCTFASAIAAELAKGKKIKKAVRIAKDYLTKALRQGARLKIGQGSGPVNHFP